MVTIVVGKDIQFVKLWAGAVSQLNKSSCIPNAKDSSTQSQNPSGRGASIITLKMEPKMACESSQYFDDALKDSSMPLELEPNSGDSTIAFSIAFSWQWKENY